MESNKQRYLFIGLAVVGFVLLTGVVVLLFLNGRNGRGLKGQNDDETADVATVLREATAVTFTELNADPFRYLNTRIRVSGQYQPPILPTCVHPAGPERRWSLINDELALEAINFTALLRLAPTGLTMTVEGIWRQYEGPVGCEKGERGTVFYLSTTQIISPNPISNATGTNGSVRPTITDEEATTSPPFTANSAATPTPENGETPTAVSTPRITPSPTPTRLPLDGSSTVVPTGTPTRTTATPTRGASSTPTRTASPTASGTPNGGTATPTPTPSPTTGAATSVPPGGLPTAPPGSYPPPSASYP